MQSNGRTEECAQDGAGDEKGEKRIGYMAQLGVCDGSTDGREQHGQHGRSLCQFLRQTGKDNEHGDVDRAAANAEQAAEKAGERPDSCEKRVSDGARNINVKGSDVWKERD